MNRKYILSVLLSLFICCVGAGALAKTETAHGLTIASDTGDWMFADYGMLTITRPGEYTLSGSGKYVTVSDVKGDVMITMNSVTLKNISSLSPMSILNSGKTTLILKGNSELSGGSRYVAALDNGVNPLEITCVGCGTSGHRCGEINVTGNYWSAAIGSGYEKTSDNILISGGIVNATSPFYGAAIGGGYHGMCQGITITGGTVNALSKHQGAAIGSGVATTCKNIVISGGVVNATSEYLGTAIGGGSSGYVDGITISGGTVTAIAEDQTAIGCGQNSTCKNILISGGTVKAVTDSLGAAIGCGTGGKANGIVISGGTVVAESTSGAAIGAGYGGVKSTIAENILISGGNVVATSEYTGIGCDRHGSASSIVISGGDVTVTSTKGTAIGCGENGSVSDITISGGVVRAAGGGDSAAIGGTGNSSVKNITISGGSIEAKGGAKGTDGIGCGTKGTIENIMIEPKSWRIDASISNTGFDSMDKLEGSPFVSGKTDVTDMLHGQRFFRTIGEYIPFVDPPDENLPDDGGAYRPDMPDTGDDADVTLWTMLFALSCSLFCLFKCCGYGVCPDRAHRNK